LNIKSKEEEEEEEEEELFNDTIPRIRF